MRKKLGQRLKWHGLRINIEIHRDLYVVLYGGGGIGSNPFLLWDGGAAYTAKLIKIFRPGKSSSLFPTSHEMTDW